MNAGFCTELTPLCSPLLSHYMHSATPHPAHCSIIASRRVILPDSGKAGAFERECEPIPDSSSSIFALI